MLINLFSEDDAPPVVSDPSLPPSSPCGPVSFRHREPKTDDCA